MPFEIRRDDPARPEIAALLREHLVHMRAITPEKSVHALDAAGLSASDVTFFSAWADETLVGCGALRELDATHGELKSMRTVEARRGLGVGSAMLAHLLETAHRRGYARVSLETGAFPAFEPARALYRKFGFVECGPFGSYSDDPNSVFMTKVIAR